MPYVIFVLAPFGQRRVNCESINKSYKNDYGDAFAAATAAVAAAAAADDDDGDDDDDDDGDGVHNIHKLITMISIQLRK